MNTTLKIYCDGGARGNPGPAAAAFIAEKDGKIVGKLSRFLGRATNNIAEYSAVILALSWLVKNNKVAGGEVEITLDSELVTKQLSGVFKIKNERLRELYYQTKNLEKKIDGRITYTHVFREKNKMADLLVNKALDENS
jgi:ribonuclease HI